MAESEHKVSTAIEPHSEEFNERQAPSQPPKTTAPAAGRGGAGGSPFHIIKPGQGTYVRWGTAIGAGLLTLGGTFFISDQIQVIRVVAESYTLRTMIPVAFMLGMAYLIFWAVGRKQSIIDFMIATEGEMKKVNWSSRKEVWGATKVVILTVFALGLILAIVDLVFILFFSGIGVIRMPLIEKLFGSFKQ
jgi:preprotein translocase SecE subunit